MPARKISFPQAAFFVLLGFVAAFGTEKKRRAAGAFFHIAAKNFSEKSKKAFRPSINKYKFINLLFRHGKMLENSRGLC